MVCSPACILTSSTSTSMSSGLARASWTSMELFEMDMHQLQQAAAMVMLSDINTNAQQQCSIKEMASKLATSSSSSVAVGERAARTTVEHACSHRRHERHERRVQRHLPSRAILISIYLLSYLVESNQRTLSVSRDVSLGRESLGAAVLVERPAAASELAVRGRPADPVWSRG